MLASRLLDQKILAASKENKFRKRGYFECTGEEAGPAVIGALLKDTDYFLPHYRGVASVISRNVPLKTIVGEILGKETGVCMGKGVSPINFLIPSFGIYPQGGMLGNGFSIAVGAGLSARHFGEGRIAAIVFGDGGASRGTLWSALNLSALWQLPILWVCVNNKYSIATPVNSLTKTPFFEKARSFGLSAKKIDGNDMFSIFETARDAINDMRNSSLPAFLELDTYRLAPHESFFMRAEPQLYEKEKTEWESRDPLILAEKKIIEYGIASETVCREIGKEIQEKIETTVVETLNDPNLSKATLLHYGNSGK